MTEAEEQNAVSATNKSKSKKYRKDKRNF